MQKGMAPLCIAKSSDDIVALASHNKLNSVAKSSDEIVKLALYNKLISVLASMN